MTDDPRPADSFSQQPPSENAPGNHVRTEDLCEVIITGPDADWLADFVKMLITDRLCAGTHHFERIRSIYPWRGQLHDTSEARVALRTRTHLVTQIIQRTVAAHPYEVPGVVAMPIIAANPAYADWIREHTQSPHDEPRSAT